MKIPNPPLAPLLAKGEDGWISIFEFRILCPFLYRMILKEEAADNNGKGADPANGGCWKTSGHSTQKAKY